MTEIMENMAEETMPEIEVVERKNAFCVISKEPASAPLNVRSGIK